MSENDAARGKRKERVGVVVSDKMDKTITVKVEIRLTSSSSSKIWPVFPAPGRIIVFLVGLPSLVIIFALP